MNDLIFHVTDGPAYKPNGFYKARIVRRSDQAGFFVVQSVRGGDTNIVPEANIRIYWGDNPNDESSANPRGAVEVPRPVGEQPAQVVSGGA